MTGFTPLAGAIAAQSRRSAAMPTLRLLRRSPLRENSLDQCDGL
ncbi:hypothetical protein [Halomicronema sp. CCY15110]|nr:hypothetical protein [Halomicronema sp. CCY15110]